jgi:HdeA/HdeB family
MMNRFSFTTAVFLILTAQALAESVDMSTLTCEQTLAGNAEDMTTTLIWLDGWLAGQADSTMLDPDQLGKQVEGILTVCQENTSMSLMNAAKQYLAE